MVELTKTAAEVFEPFNVGGSARGPVMEEAQTWGTELEVALAALEGAGGVGGGTTATPFVDVPSATTIDLGAATSRSVNITGATGPVVSFGGSADDGAEFLLRWNAVIIITESSDIITGVGDDITTFPGMHMLLKHEGSGVWRVVSASQRLNVFGGGANRVEFIASALSGDCQITLPNAPVAIPAGTLAALSQLLGVAQVWSDVTGSRLLNTSYQNVGARPRQIQIKANNSGNGANVTVAELSSDGSTWSEIYNWYSLATTAASTETTCWAVVPPLYFYRLRGTASTTIRNWKELS